MIQMIVIAILLVTVKANYTKCGTTCDWVYNNGVLTITGSGVISDYDSFHYVYPPWNDHRKTITSIIVGEGITVIGTSAFYGCVSVTSISLPSTVTTLKEYSFAFCTDLKTLTIPQSVVSIEEHVFRGCIHLNKLKYMSHTAPMNCTKMTFRDCKRLKSITVQSQYYYQSTSFCSYSKLAAENENQSGTCGNKCKWEYDAQTGKVMIKGEETITDFTSGRSPWFLLKAYVSSIEIGEGITSIGNYAFYNLTELESVTIGRDVSAISDTAFENCVGLTTVQVNSINNPTCSEETFASSPSLTEVSVPSDYLAEGNFCGKQAIEREDSYNFGVIVGLTTTAIVLLVAVVVGVAVVDRMYRKRIESSYHDL